MYEYVKYFTYSYLSKKKPLKMNYVLFLAQEKNQKNMHLKIIAKNFPPLHYNKITRPAKVLIATGGTQTDFVVDVLLREFFLTQFF